MPGVWLPRGAVCDRGVADSRAKGEAWLLARCSDFIRRGDCRRADHDPHQFREHIRALGRRLVIPRQRCTCSSFWFGAGGAGGRLDDAGSSRTLPSALDIPGNASRPSGARDIGGWNRCSRCWRVGGRWCGQRIRTTASSVGHGWQSGSRRLSSDYERCAHTAGLVALSGGIDVACGPNRRAGDRGLFRVLID